MFAGLQDSDLAAYLPARAGSNLSTRPRMEVKQRLLSLASALTLAARSAGVSLELRASDERPSIWNQHRVTAQWLWLWRDADARRHLEAVLDQGRTLAASLNDPTPFVRHAFLAVKVDAEGVEVYGPADAPLGLVRGRRRKRFLVRAGRNVDLPGFMAAWRARAKIPNSVRVTIDIDPYSFL
jgi:hypothetical protein